MVKTIDKWLVKLADWLLNYARTSNDVSYDEFKVIQKNYDDAIAKRAEWLASKERNGK